MTGARACKAVLGLLAALMLLAPLPVLAGLAGLAIPQPGHYFYGDVTSKGEPMGEGTLVTAKVVGTSLEYSTTVDVHGHYGYSPNFNIPADDSWTPEREGARPGEPIEFYVNGHRVWLYDVTAGRWCGSSYPFEIGGTTDLDLEAFAPHRTLLPIVVLDW